MMRKGILVAAAGLLATSLTAAAAGDRPPRPRHAEPPKRADAKACASYGAGFVKLPGSSTCVKVGGSVEVDSVQTFGR